ncbi:hypothetical protein HDU97_004527 [Phlyctochytrium planicorne]|nr:hypothetical protein HDU97_004527 [Phlyctochytrium planicorne]
MMALLPSTSKFFAAVTTFFLAIALELIPRNLGDRKPSYFYLIKTVVDVVYTFFWLAAASTITSLSNACLGWNDKNVNCSGLSAAAAFGFFVWFTFVGALVMDFLPIANGSCSADDFINGKASEVANVAPEPLTSVMVQGPAAEAPVPFAAVAAPQLEAPQPAVSK